MIAAKHLTFRYGTQAVVTDLSLHIPAGAFLGILGPNGSGKTTLLKLLSGTLRPHQGQIQIQGEDLHRLTHTAIAERIAVVPQETHIPFSFTALEVVLMGRSPYLKTFAFETQEDMEIARQAMELTGVSHLSHRFIETLSGGEKQRVIVARALAQRTPILLLDEPTAHLDIKHQIDIHNLLQRLNETQGLTIVNVLHDLNLAAHYCHEIALLKNGQIVHQGVPRQVITQENVQEVFETSVPDYLLPHSL